MDEIAALHREIVQCRLCEEAGVIERAAPVVCDPVSGRIMLIGQAPGRVELVVRRPFQGKAGRVLFGWLRSVDIGEEEFRAHVYMTAVTKCFPGTSRNGNGDRRPSVREMHLCRPFLDRQLAMLSPEVVLLVGTLAIEQFLPREPLRDLVGRDFAREGITYIPLPHPSGASRWLNDADNRVLLESGLALVRGAWDRHVLSNLRRAG